MPISGVVAAEDAEIYAKWAHGLKDQKDKIGNPYDEHLRAVGDIAVALQKEKKVPWWCENEHDLRAAAWLHDTIEDTRVTMKDLTDRGYNSVVLKIVEAITKRPSEQQHLYLARIITAGRGAMLVKLADLYHNTDISRLSLLDGGTQVRLLEKYTKAIGALEALLEIDGPTRRAWALRQLLAQLKKKGYTASSYSSTNYSYNSTNTVGYKWDPMQGKSVPPTEFIGGPSWDGFYPDARKPGYGLTRAEKDDKGKYIVPPQEFVHKKVTAAWNKEPDTDEEWARWDGWWKDEKNVWHKAEKVNGIWTKIPDRIKDRLAATVTTTSKEVVPVTTRCVFPGTHKKSCNCATPGVYTPSLDYAVQAAKATKALDEGDVN